MRRPSTRPELLISEPSKSQAVLIGVHAYKGAAELKQEPKDLLEDRPTVASGVTRLAELLQNEGVWGLPRENLTLLQEPDSREGLLDKIKHAADAATDTLVVYYAGHGLLYSNVAGLHLAMPWTTKNRPYSAVAYSDLRSVLLSARKVRRKVVILDCCFSGQALDTLGVVPDTALAVEGTSILTATRNTQLALAPKDEEYPAFTGAIISVLESGDQRGPEFFSMGDLFERVQEAMNGRNRPLPDQLNHDQGAQICIARNVRYEEPAESDDPAITPAAAHSATRRRAWQVIAGTLLLLGITVPVILDQTAFSNTGSSPNSATPSGVLPGIKCGRSQDSPEVSIKVVHDAACKGDFNSLEVAMNRAGFDGLGFRATDPNTVIAAWQKRTDRLALLQDLVSLLEEKPKVDQGGITFSNGRQIAIWARGWDTDPDTLARWSGFYDCSQPADAQSVACKTLR